MFQQILDTTMAALTLGKQQHDSRLIVESLHSSI